MKNLAKNFVFIIFIFLTISAIFAMFYQPFEQKKETSLSQLMEDINQEKIKKIVVSGNNIQITYQDDSKAQTKKETEASFSETLANYGISREKISKIDFEVQEERGLSFWLGPISVFLFPLLILGLFFWLMFRQAKAGAMQAFN